MRKRLFIVAGIAALMLVVILVAAFRSATSMENFEPQTWSEAESATGLSRDELSDISAAVLAVLFDTHGAVVKPDANAYCVEVFGGDAEPEFLEQFADIEPPLRNRNAFAEGEDVLFRIQRVEAPFWGGYRVYAEVYWGNVGTFGKVLAVVRKNGEWEVRTPWIAGHWVS